MSDFHSLKIKEIKRETPSAVSVSFDVPAELKDTFQFEAGQYITIKKEIDGEELRRAYSICEAPQNENLKVAIKEMPNGTFSKFANQSLQEGTVLEVMPPEGRFTFIPNGTVKNIAAFAAGSGITPILGIAKTVLQNDVENTFTLVYGNRSLEDTIFRDELLELKEKYTERFNLYFVYSQSDEDDALFGRIDRSIVNLITKNKHKDTAFDAFYLCGPQAMIETVSDTLVENGIDKTKILFELFTSEDTEATIDADLEGKTKVKVLVDDEEFEFVMDQKQTVLEAALKENIDAPYSCQGGICSSCIAKLKEGKVVMDKNQILTDGELEEGFILTCQSHPTTPKIVVDYDDV
ncbi:2Fe-2S iron-sulfur cluster-binding protein [Sungkyunkwania multivorans]|uniref:2Fe-2S iron-sulfur cluster-binding protein n=1 Tax=Sungkyunkwania multivorans TaxID=1173618 RepID=A0ABW3D217_9FLAO